MKTSDTTSAVFEALVLFEAGLPQLTKDKTAKIPTKSGGSFSYRYASLDSIIAHCRDHLSMNGLAVTQEAVGDSGGVGIVTRIVHSSGEWVEHGPLCLPSNGDAQARGSMITYARRYALCAALGIAADEDDDASSAKKKSPAATATKSEPVDEESSQSAARTSEGSDAGAYPVGSSTTWEEIEARSKVSAGSERGEGAGSAELSAAKVAAENPKGDGPASQYLWAEAARKGYTRAKVLATLKKAGQPVTDASSVTERQLASITQAGQPA